MRSIYGQAESGSAGPGRTEPFLLSLPPLPAVVLPGDSSNNNNWGACYPCRVFTSEFVCACVCVCVTHALVQLPRRSILLMAIDLCARRDFILGMRA